MVRRSQREGGGPNLTGFPWPSRSFLSPESIFDGCLYQIKMFCVYKICPVAICLTTIDSDSVFLQCDIRSSAKNMKNKGN